MDEDKSAILMLGEIKGQLASLITLTTAKHNEYDQKHNDHDQRLRKLEHGKAWLLGAAAVIGTVVSIIVGFFK